MNRMTYIGMLVGIVIGFMIGIAIGLVIYKGLTIW